MTVEILKDWASYKKGALIEIEDKSVIDEGLRIGLFKEVKAKK
jgi:hypothetical protein